MNRIIAKCSQCFVEIVLLWIQLELLGHTCTFISIPFYYMVESRRILMNFKHENGNPFNFASKTGRRYIFDHTRSSLSNVPLKRFVMYFCTNIPQITVEMLNNTAARSQKQIKYICVHCNAANSLVILSQIFLFCCELQHVVKSLLCNL